MMRKATTKHIHCVSLIDADIDLGFKISCERTLKLTGVDFPFLVNQTVKTKESECAKHCIIVLLGGKSILVDIEDEDSKRLTCKVYLPVPNNPVSKFVVSIGGLSHLDVNGYIMDLANRQFSVEEVKSLLNKRPG